MRNDFVRQTGVVATGGEDGAKTREESAGASVVHRHECESGKSIGRWNAKELPGPQHRRSAKNRVSVHPDSPQACARPARFLLPLTFVIGLPLSEIREKSRFGSIEKFDWTASRGSDSFKYGYHEYWGRI
jgi:hypothetical protein